MDIPVEVVASTLDDVKAASVGGADRVELCVNLACGGLTPGRSLAEMAMEMCQSLGLGLRVLVRPREGDFVYTAQEVELVVREAKGLIDLGVEKVVVGGLDDRGLPDLVLVRSLSSAVGLDRVVFHRALDESVHFAEAVDRLAAEGIEEALTSGGAPRAIEGLEGTAQAARHFSVVAGSGVQPDHVGPLVKAGARAVHASCRVPANSTRPGRLFATERSRVDAHKVRQLVEAVRFLGPTLSA